MRLRRKFRVQEVRSYFVESVYSNQARQMGLEVKEEVRWAVALTQIGPVPAPEGGVGRITGTSVFRGMSFGGDGFHFSDLTAEEASVFQVGQECYLSVSLATES